MYDEFDNSAKRLNVEKKIWRGHSDNPFTWRDIKNNKFEDDDVIRLEWVEAFHSENNGWDGHFSGSVTRLVPETDEQFNKRQKRAEVATAELRERRYQNYLKLKKEFEPE